MNKGLISWIAIVAIAVIALPACAQDRQFPTNKPMGDLNTLTDAEKADGWKLLFNGKNLEGWEFDTEQFKGDWYVDEGILVSDEAPRSSHLFTKKKYKNFELSWDVCAYDVAVPKQRFGNSGVFVRCIKTGGSFPSGYEVQVDPYDIKNPTGGIYGKAPGTLLVENGKWKPEAFLQVHEGKWINQRVRIVDDHIMIWINGEKTLDWKDPKNEFPEAGYISLQCHHSTDIVLFTNIKIKELD